jgi:acetyl-CoA carboxylase biotin carboxyl carrier protein
VWLRSSLSAHFKGGIDVEATITAHMPGLVARVVVEKGDSVAEGQEVAVINCMKAELSVESHIGGVVKDILVKEWDEMEVGSPMLIVETT